MFADLGADIVQMAVDAIRFETAAFGAAAADLPKHLRNGELRAELGDATVAVDRQLYLVARTVFADLLLQSARRFDLHAVHSLSLIHISRTYVRVDIS